MRVVHEEEKKSLLKTIKHLKHDVSTKDQEISSLQGTTARLEAFIDQKGQVKTPWCSTIKMF